MEMLHTKEELRRLQALPLNEKIDLSKLRIIEWYEHYAGKVGVSFSGGKDSAVLLHLVRSVYPEVPAVYADTRLDYPEVRELIKQTDNVIWVKPNITFKQVIDKYGYCYPSKEVAKYVNAARRNAPFAIKVFNGDYPPTRRVFLKSVESWKWLVNLDAKISEKCCYYMKEKPIHTFNRKNGMYLYVALLASESMRRYLTWLKNGCNAFNTRYPSSKPLSFWTEDDIFQYVVTNNIPIPSVYGNIEKDANGKYICTGVKRTGCIFCPIASHLEKPNKFQQLKISHPKLYSYCMKELGLDDFLNKVGVPH